MGKEYSCLGSWQDTEYMDKEYTQVCWKGRECIRGYWKGRESRCSEQTNWREDSSTAGAATMLQEHCKMMGTNKDWGETKLEKMNM